MSAKGILIGLIGLVLIAGVGIAGWLLVLSRGGAGSGAPTDVGTNVGATGNETTVTNTTGANSGTNGSGGQAATTANLEQSYTTLFQQLLATGANFAWVNASSTLAGQAGDASAVYALYAADIANNKKMFPQASTSIQLALTDLTNDGVPEALVYENIAYTCGTAGCPLDIYQKQKGKWVLLFTKLVGPKIGISNTLTSGFLDLFLTVGGSVPGTSAVERFVWNGSTYTYKEVVATWDGAKFNLVQ